MIPYSNFFIFKDRALKFCLNSYIQSYLENKLFSIFYSTKWLFWFIVTYDLCREFVKITKLLFLKPKKKLWPFLPILSLIWFWINLKFVLTCNLKSQEFKKNALYMYSWYFSILWNNLFMTKLVAALYPCHKIQKFMSIKDFFMIYLNKKIL